ncbi:competence protein ComEC [Gelidibacter algens]|uniref:Competence protein ComEC n=1 Tax=Gelidibacter algens TaxID=49280 RepID=A0A1A7QXC7_9FLAO|nr:ComEC/Rec2 family competence protein [Gelidibacter algens]OBX24211.1 competence protein [Gelidibacter algens]RAJ22709.1 competence protein ComEC [Gelidibacter algens]
MKLLNFALIKITGCLIAGIIFIHYFELQIKVTLVAVGMLLISLSGFLIVEKGRWVKSNGFGILALFTFFVIGILTYQLHDQKTFKTHYTQHIDPAKDSIETITFRIREVLKPSAYHNKYSVDILKINNQSLSGKTLLNVQKDSLSSPFKVDDVFLDSSNLVELSPPLNPDQFDYKAYLQKQYIYHQVFSDHQHLLKLSSNTQTFFGYAANLRRTINTKLKSKNFKPDELALINALLLGQRQDISPEIYDSYTKAGAIHILAVSGLHVGIILLLLNSLFKPLEYLRHGKIIKTVVLVLMLWSFAIIAGLSASVTRAVMMFSIVAIGMNLKSPSNIYNTLVISMLFLLLFKPLFLFDVGFQMSYLAVLAIVSIQPSLVKLWLPKFKPLNKLWQIFTVTLAAQLGVVPISLFYFHQFPGLFFISNLVIIPVLGIILGLGILVIFLGLINFLPTWLADLYGGMISIMNSFVRWISQQERFVFQDVSFGLLQVFTAYLLIVTFLLLFKKQNFKRLTIAMIAVLIFQSVLIFDKNKNQTEAFIVFHKSRYSMMGIKKNATMTVLHNLDSSIYSRDNVTRNFKVGNALTAIKQDTLQSIYIFNNQKILVVDSSGVYKLPQFQPKYVVLRNSPKINLTRLLETIKPTLIIADGSNYKSYLERWEASCIKQNVPFHLTSREGAFVLKKD